MTKPKTEWEEKLKEDIRGSILDVLTEEEMDNLIGLFRIQIDQARKEGTEWKKLKTDECMLNIELIKQQARKEGYEEGYKKGAEESIEGNYNEIVKMAKQQARKDCLEEVERKIDEMPIKTVGNSAKTVEQIKALIQQIK